jgi:hypothetical protein
MAANAHAASESSLLIVLPALVDHPGVIAWGKGFELAKATHASLHVLYVLGGAMPDDAVGIDRALVAAEDALQQWVLGRTIGWSGAEETELHLTPSDHAEAAVRAVVRRGEIDTVVVARCDDTVTLVDGLVADAPCSVVLASAAPRPSAPIADEPPLRSSTLATPAPLPAPPVVTDAIG